MKSPSDAKIVWLSSFPKSGNTWFRAFLTALLSEDNKVDINNLWINYNYADRQLFDLYSGLNASELKLEEINELKSEVFRSLSQDSDIVIYVKTHEYYRCSKKDVPIIPTDATSMALYFIRNPLDVCVSLAHHLNCSLDKSIKIMNAEASQRSGNMSKSPVSTLPEDISSWSTHAKSWIDQSEFPVQIIRYEDMLSSPLETFTKAVKAINVKYNDSDILQAIDACSFEKLQEQEKKSVFGEKNIRSSNFFRSGKHGNWKNILNLEQQNSVINCHREVMQMFGYL